MTQSFYRFGCICTHERADQNNVTRIVPFEIESPEPTGACPNCGRLFDVSAWGEEPVIVK